MEREKTRGEMIAERLEKEADEMMKQIQDSQTESEPEAQGLAIPEREAEDTPEEVQEEVENSPDESQDTEDASDQNEEIQEEDAKQDDSLKDSQWQERYKNAQAKMTKEIQRSKELEAKIAEMDNKIRAMEVMKSDSKKEQQTEDVNAELGDLKKDYPEIANALQRYVDLQIQSVNRKMDQTTDELLQAKKEESQRVHDTKIADAHPDHQAIANSEDFHLWLDRQADHWKYAADKGSADAVIELLSHYKKSLGLESKTVSKEELVEKAKQNVEPSLSKARKQNVGSNKKVWTAKEIGKLSDKDFLKYEKEIDEAYASGKLK